MVNILPLVWEKNFFTFIFFPPILIHITQICDLRWKETTFPTVVAKETYISIGNLLHGTVPGASNALISQFRKAENFLREKKTQWVLITTIMTPISKN